MTRPLVPLTYPNPPAEASSRRCGSLRRGGRNKARPLRLLFPELRGALFPARHFREKELDMSKSDFRRPVLAAFGGVLLLSAAGMAAAFAGPDYRATLSGSNIPGGGDRDG